MKILLIVIISIGCQTQQENKTNPVIKKTAGFFINKAGYLEGGFFYYGVRDTTFFDTVNTTTAKKITRIDTLYFIPATYNLIDSMKNPLLNEDGKQRTTTRYELTNDSLVWFAVPERNFPVEKAIDSEFHKMYK